MAFLALRPGERIQFRPIIPTLLRRKGSEMNPRGAGIEGVRVFVIFSHVKLSTVHSPPFSRLIPFFRSYDYLTLGSTPTALQNAVQVESGTVRER